MIKAVNANNQLKAIVARIEKLEADKSDIAADIREVYLEAAGNGYDKKALRTIIKIRKQDANERAEQEALVETYLNALGMLIGTPLGDAAMASISH